MRHLKAKIGRKGSELSDIGQGNGIIYKKVFDGILLNPKSIIKFISPLQLETENHFDNIEIIMDTSHEVIDKNGIREWMISWFNLINSN